MSDQTPIRRIAGLRPVAIADEGDTAVFELVLETGETLQFGLSAGGIHAVVANLTHMAATAEAYRNKRPAEFRQDEVVVPYHLSGVTTGVTTAGTLAVRLETTQGVPIVVSMSADQAKELRTKLRRGAENLLTRRSGH